MNGNTNYLQCLEQGRVTRRKECDRIREEYYLNPIKCKQCNKAITYRKRKINKFCSHTCAAIFNNTGRVKVKRHCLECKKELIGRSKRANKFCNKECNGKYIQKVTQKNFLSELKNGNLNRITKTGGTPYKPRIKNLITVRDGNSCSICSMPAEWEFRPIVLILDHIDGNSENNSLDNLRLVCPNCDSQLPTFKGRNTGNGRYYRRQRYKAGKSY